MKKIVILTGAGISAESGIKTFRDADGLWEGHNVMDVASPEGWHRNKDLVLDFYNQRRRQLLEVKPNYAHIVLAELENDFDVQIITQNVDNLHEMAGSTKVLHLHGELLKVRSTINEDYILDWECDLVIGDVDNKGHQLRPHIVWFGEQVPMIEPAIEMVKLADIVIVIGTSLQVYPAAALLNHAPYGSRKFLVDPSEDLQSEMFRLTHIQETAGKAMPKLVDELIREFEL